MSTKIKKIKRLNQDRKSFYLFILPWIVGFLTFTLLPMVISIVLSFTSARTTTLTYKLNFVGFMNFQDIFTTDMIFLRSIGNTFLYAFLKVILGIVTATAYAMLFNCKYAGRGFFRVLIYLPSVIPAVSSALIWSLLVFSENGFVVALIRNLGLGTINFANPASALPTAVVVNSFGMAGPWMIVILAALQNVPKDIVEAARIEGASKWKIFVKITLPMISPNLFFLVVTGFINSLQAYEEVALLLDIESTKTMTMSIYSHIFGGYGIGYACAQSWIVFIIIMIFTGLFFKFGGKKVYYAGD